MSARNVFRGLFWGLVALLFLAHVVGGWLYSGSIVDEGFTPNPQAITVPRGDYELIEVTYESPLGPMDAWHLPASGGTWVIHVHGLNATPAEPEVLFPVLQDAGYPQLAIAYRNDEGQPADPSGYYRYGATEWEDVAAAVQFATASGADGVVIAGYGTGASHVLSYVYRNNLDEIAGVITDSANIDFGSTVDYRGTQETLPVLGARLPPTFAAVAKFITSLSIDVNWKSLDYIDRAKRSLRVPVLAIHGSADESVPISQSIELSETQPDLVRLVEFPGAGHVGSFDSDYDRYVNAVLTFLEDVS